MTWRAKATSALATLRTLAMPRSNLRSILAWPMLALLLGLLGWGTLVDHLARERRHAENAALAQAAALARGYAKQTNRTILSVDLVLRHVRYEWELTDGKLPLELLGRAGMFPSSAFWNVAIANRQGHIVNSAIQATSNINTDVRDRAFFIEQQRGGNDALYIGAPIMGRSSGRMNIPFSRRLLGSDGAFDGVAVVGARPDYFTVFYDATTLGVHGFLGLVGADGAVRVARIGSTIHATPAQVLLAPVPTTAPSGSQLVPGSTWFSDGRNRFIGWDRVADFPLATLIGIDEADAMAGYWSERAALLHTALLATLGLVLLSLAAMVLAMRLAWRKRQWDINQLSYRLATESGHEGFYIARRILDNSGAIVDFDIVDSNRRGAEMLGQRREELIGKKISDLYRGYRPNRVLAMLRKAMHAGLFDSTIEVGANSPLRARWVHLTIVRSGENVAVTVRDMSDTKAHIAELERRSSEDALTGLPNRHWVHTCLPARLSRARERSAMVALLFIDLDGFKAVNDSAGHAAGDELLQAVAQRLQASVRPHDQIARWGGDEFVVLLEKIDHADDAAHMAARVLAAFEARFKLAKGLYTVGASIGISVCPGDAGDADELLRHADAAMYSVKHQGRGHYQFFSQQYYDALRRRQELEQELRDAVEQDQFVVYYQPRVDVHSGALASLEALLRWQHPRRGLLEPLEFIAQAEQSSLIAAIGTLVIDKVCRQMASWAEHGAVPLPVSINVSARQFDDSNVAAELRAAIVRHAIAPALLEIEITESSVMSDSADIAAALAGLRQMGVKLLVDDFGTGYSSLAQLQSLDFDVLKVDRAFTARVDESERGRVLFKTIITMAHALGMRVVAEGVETARQMAILKSLDCDELQGYYLARPAPPGARQPVLEAHLEFG